VKFSHTLEKIAVLADMLKDHAVIVWANIDKTQRAMITRVVERIGELKEVAETLRHKSKYLSPVEPLKEGTSTVLPVAKELRPFQLTDGSNDQGVMIPLEVAQFPL